MVYLLLTFSCKFRVIFYNVPRHLRSLVTFFSAFSFLFKVESNKNRVAEFAINQQVSSAGLDRITSESKDPKRVDTARKGQKSDKEKIEDRLLKNN